ncbi:oxidoreductase [Ochrobactrum sp. 695/2009]|nr:molybdopterin-dependent oxidoreductase [Brucella intermedia]PJR92487.1 oxidoreductase [Ochrobactrum sp. 721/2009]PJT13575.1 oxidoreductase [Ochrobactrum sp. 720/2009]PJT18072.1 oxidoreductase [Ochrobactrum sp. 715/2009]PJT21778.1 oxidoreductase [Ochrobactrum sp. 695/2009]PJT31797.1 oxidoreductase [Ochrobactrum sp. 689/2009]
MNSPAVRVAWLQCLTVLALFVATPTLSKDLARATGPVLLTVTGMIERTNEAGAALFDADLLSTFSAHRIETHTPWTDGIARFDGVLLKDVLAAVGARGDTLVAEALNGYRIPFPAADSEEFGVLLAMRMDGKPLSRRDKGPLWIVYPRDSIAELRDERYDSRWVWQLNKIEIR